VVTVFGQKQMSFLGVGLLEQWRSFTKPQFLKLFCNFARFSCRFLQFCTIFMSLAKYCSVRAMFRCTFHLNKNLCHLRIEGSFESVVQRDVMVRDPLLQTFVNHCIQTCEQRILFKWYGSTIDETKFFEMISLAPISWRDQENTITIHLQR
jgi:hypothetical protein